MSVRALLALLLVSAAGLHTGAVSARAGQVSASATQSLRILVVAGEDSINIIERGTATAPIVEVRDKNSQPVAGIVVVFAVRGRASGTFAGNTSVSVTTNAAGRAQAIGWTPTDRGLALIEATTQQNGETASVMITQTNVVTPQEAASLRASRANLESQSRPAESGGSHTGRNVLIGIVGGAAAAELYVLATRDDGSGGASAPANTAPVATITAAKTLGLQAATSFTFTAAASDIDKDTLTYAWTTDDGQSSSAGATATFTFQTAGTKTVRVSVSDGKTSTTAQITVDVRSITGRWIGTIVCPGTLCSQSAIALTATMDLVQTGTTVTGTATLSSTAITLLTNCTVASGVVVDSVATPQRLQLPIGACSATFISGLSCIGTLDNALVHVLPNTSGTASSCDVTKQ